MTDRISDVGISRRGFCAAMGAGALAASLPKSAFGASRGVVAATGLDAYHVPYAVAARHKLFEKYGLTLEYKPFDDGSVSLDALLTGGAHLGSASEVAGLTRWGKTKAIFIAGTVASASKLHAVVANASIKKPQDLLGKTVAFPKFSGGHYFFNTFAKRHALPIEEIKTVQVAAPETIAAMQRGDIDAFFLWEPWPSRAVELVEGAHVLAWAEDLDLKFTTMSYYSKPLVEDHELAVAVTKGLIDAADFCQNDPKETAKVVSEAFRIAPEDAVRFVNNLTYRIEMDKNTLLPDLVDYADFCLEAGLINEMPDWDEFLRPDIMRDAAPDRLIGWQL